MKKDTKAVCAISTGIIALFWAMMAMVPSSDEEMARLIYGVPGMFAVAAIWFLCTFPVAMLAGGIWAGLTQSKWYRFPLMLLGGNGVHFLLMLLYSLRHSQYGLQGAIETCAFWGAFLAVGGGVGLLTGLTAHCLGRERK